MFLKTMHFAEFSLKRTEITVKLSLGVKFSINLVSKFAYLYNQITNKNNNDTV